MKIETIPIEKGQYLRDIYPLIESDIILNKRLSGVGATHCEIVAPRNSIIVVPNLPIITCKVERHKESDNLFGVMQYIKPIQIVKYLEKTLANNLYIKIMVTPESFTKVKEAFNEIGLNMYDKCFLLIDECHKFITESDFRKDITIPFVYFFKFKNKALVSATPLVPSDPRFEEQDFKLVIIEPQYDFMHHINIIETDDIKKAFQKEISWIKNGTVPPGKEPQCFFINDIDLMIEMIIQSNLQDISSVFCSDQSFHKFKDRGIKNVHIEWKNEYQEPLMFFTSRFYTGLDIWLDNPPKVYYFSDAKNGDYTLMDPFTDMAQACGRFRRGMKEIDHYVIFNYDAEPKTSEQIESSLTGEKRAYNALKELYEKTENIFEREAILNILQKLPHNEIFTNGEINYFLKDKWEDIERVKSYYKNLTSLRKAYGESKYFYLPGELDPYFFNNSINQFFDKISKRQRSISTLKKRQRKAIIDFLEIISPYYKTDKINELIGTFSSYDKLIVDAYFKLGSEFIKQCNYNTQRIKEELAVTSHQNSYDEGFYDLLLSTFENGKKYLCSDAKEKLIRIYQKFNIKPPSGITAQSLKWFFEIESPVKIGNNKAIKIIRPTAEGLLNYITKTKNNINPDTNEAIED